MKCEGRTYLRELEMLCAAGGMRGAAEPQWAGTGAGAGEYSRNKQRWELLWPEQ
jgi:hypothetical protein